MSGSTVSVVKDLDKMERVFHLEKEDKKEEVGNTYCQFEEEVVGDIITEVVGEEVYNSVSDVLVDMENIGSENVVSNNRKRREISVRLPLTSGLVGVGDLFSFYWEDAICYLTGYFALRIGESVDILLEYLGYKMPHCIGIHMMLFSICYMEYKLRNGSTISSSIDCSVGFYKLGFILDIILIVYMCL